MYHDLLQGFNIKNPCPPLAINVPKQDIQWAEAEQQRLGVKESGYILIHGGSSQLAVSKGIDKIYPTDNWKQIIEDCQQRQPNFPVVVVKAAEDAGFVTKLVELCPNVKVISPDDVGKLATIAAANLMICTDSAPMHLAVAVQTYTIALFRPTNRRNCCQRAIDFWGLNLLLAKWRTSLLKMF